jgi:hypothetical protein
LLLNGNYSGKPGMKLLIEALNQNRQITSIKLPNKAQLKGPGRSAGLAEAACKRNAELRHALFTAAKSGDLVSIQSNLSLLFQSGRPRYHITNAKGWTLMEVAKKHKQEGIIGHLRTYSSKLRLPPFPSGIEEQAQLERRIEFSYSQTHFIVCGFSSFTKPIDVILWIRLYSTWTHSLLT